MLGQGESRPLFFIQLKINGEVLDIEVLESDDRESLTERVCRNNRISNEYKRILEGKIMEALRNITQRQQINLALREKVQKFVRQNAELPQRHIHTIPTEPNNQTEGEVSVASPIKLKSPQKKTTPIHSKENLIESSASRNVQSRKKEQSCSPNRHREPCWNLYGHRIANGSSVQQEIKKSVGNNVFVEAIDPLLELKTPVAAKQEGKRTHAGIKKQNTIPYKTTMITKQHNNVSIATIAKQPSLSSDKKQVHKKTLTETDEDLIKAYKVVVAKCKDPQMKSMAKRFLETLNRSFVTPSPQESRKKVSPSLKKDTSIKSAKKQSPPKSQPQPQIIKASAAADLSSTDRLKRLQQLKQPAIPGQLYEDRINKYVGEKYDRQPPSRLSPAKQAVPQHVALTTGNPLVDQPYERRYSKEALARSPYEYLTSNYPSISNTVNRASTGNIHVNRSSECSPFVAHSNRYHYQTHLESMQEASLPRHHSQPYSLDAKYRSTSTNNPTRRYRYLQEE